MGHRVFRRISALLGGTAACVGLCACVIVAVPIMTDNRALAAEPLSARIVSKHLDASRKRATQRPRRETDQAIVGGWPLYRTDRGQTAFNHAMATLKATDRPAPSAAIFKGCARLRCQITLPKMNSKGWLPAGRVWVSPTEYVLVAHSPRLRPGKTYRRRPHRRMRLFVFHEFHNSTFNTDVYDTISSHKFSVFVPFYMSKQSTDARGHRFVTVVQVAPYDVKSVHASNMGNAGTGIEVAKNKNEKLQSLQGLAGIVVATIVKNGAQQLRMVNHRGREGVTLLKAYKDRLAWLRANPRARKLKLPFVAATPKRVASATGRFEDLLLRPGKKPKRFKSAERKRLAAAAKPARSEPKIPAPAPATSKTRILTWSPLASYLRANLETMKRLPEFAAIVPANVAAIGERSPEEGIVYLLNAKGKILGHVEAHPARGSGQYVYVPLDGVAKAHNIFALDLSKPATTRTATLASSPSWTLIEPPRLAIRPE